MEKRFPTHLEPGVEYITTREWGELQSPPIDRKTVQELIRDGRVEGVVQPGREYLIPKDAQRLPMTQQARERIRERNQRYAEEIRRNREIARAVLERADER